MFTKNSKRRGRPPGRTPQGEATRERLFRTAIELISERGYGGATLRDVAARAAVSPALLYRYFPSKGAVALALYDELSESLARRASHPARWALARSLRPRRRVEPRGSSGPIGWCSARWRPCSWVIPRRVCSPSEPRSRACESRACFRAAVMEAKDAPPRALGEPLSRLLYLVHLCVILLWLLDRSPRQRATRAMVVLLERVCPLRRSRSSCPQSGAS
jgi:AcrR family transcriptional regulator